MNASYKHQQSDFAWEGQRISTSVETTQGQRRGEAKV